MTDTARINKLFSPQSMESHRLEVDSEFENIITVSANTPLVLKSSPMKFIIRDEIHNDELEQLSFFDTK